MNRLWVRLTLAFALVILVAVGAIAVLINQATGVRFREYITHSGMMTSGSGMEQLAAYDSSLVIGILGGYSGTTFDAFYQLWEAKKYGARAALYGRMINHSEHQGSFIEHLRWLADGDLRDSAEAVRSYYGALEKLSITPCLPLSDALQRTDRTSAYR